MTLTLFNLGKKIKNSWILRNLDFEVKDGECLALVGPSGCGKSSTLRLIAGLDKPDEGKIYIQNTDITDTSPVERRIGMVFQSYALFPHLSVSENLEIGLKIRKIPIKEQKQRVADVLTLMQLNELADRKPSDLSGGQRQRVALARALLREPLVYLLDEPMSNLDAQLREDLRPELRKLILKGNQPVIYVTHDQQEAMAMAKRIAVMNNGLIEQIGTPQQLYNEPNSIFVAKFIGRPQINLIQQEKEYLKAIRPEDIYFSNEGVSATISHLEWLGNSQLLHLETKLGTIRMKCPVNIQIPERIFIKWDKTNELTYINSTGKRI